MPPYSSTTIAALLARSRNRSSTSSAGIDSGTMSAGSVNARKSIGSPLTDAAQASDPVEFSLPPPMLP